MPAFSHETKPDWPTTQQLSEVEPAIDHSIPIARKLVAHLRHRLNARQLGLLDEVSHQLQVMQHVDAGYLGAERQPNTLEQARLVQYFRWKAERSLMDLLNGLTSPSIIELNLRDAGAAHSPDAPIVINEHDNLLLLRVIAGNPKDPTKPARLTLADWDMISERPASHFPVKISRSGTTFVLLDLKRLPAEETTTHLVFNDADGSETLYTYALTFQAAPRGQLAVDVVNDDGESVPVLINIASRLGGIVSEPAEAVDLRTVLNDVVPHLSPSGRGYMFYLPGKRRGRYWIVRPPLEMPLPAGDWDIKVLRGLEFEPIAKTVTVKQGEWTRVELQPQRWTDMRQLGWYSGDDHVHSQLLTSEDARKLLDYVRAVDINVANILEMGDVMRSYYPQRGFGDEFRVRHGNHWLVPGQEDPRSFLGHAIGLNLQSRVRDLDRYLSNDWVASEIHKQGGLYGHTHVGPNACFVHREMALFTPHRIVDFNSIMQADLGTELYYDFLNLGFKMTASAGADTPYGGTIGAVRTYAYTGDPNSLSPDDWFEAVRKGRTFVTNGPMLDLKIENSMPGDELVVDEDRQLRVSARAWGAEGWSAPSRLRLIKFGDVLHEVTASEPNQTELRLSTQVNAGRGFWIAAHAVSKDGSQAHTTPVYVTRKGFRHWKMDAAELLIERQLGVLREIESEVEKSEQLVKSGANPLDYWNRRTAEQADQVRSKVEATRRIYEDLRKQLTDQLQR